MAPTGGVDSSLPPPCFLGWAGNAKLGGGEADHE